jgi:phage-related protein (TIGR01555 family)
VLGQVNLFSGANECPFNYYGYPLHVSRVLKVLSNEAPAYIRSRLQGWGMSEIEQAIRPINAFLKFENLIFELMDEAKVDVYRLQGFAATKASGAAEAQLRRTMTAVNQSKNYANALVLDKNDEYEQKQLTFSGLAEMRNQGRMDLAAALRFPLTKLFGDSSTGFGGGQDAMENYNSVVGGVRENAEPLLLEAGILRCQQRFGLAPEDLQVKWKPLRELGGVEEQDCLTKKHTRNMDLFDRNLMTGQETMAAEKQDGVVVIDTEVGQGLREVEPPMQTEHQLGMEAQEAGGKQQMQLAKAKGKGQPARK